MRLRFRKWGSDDWTYIEAKGEFDYVVLGILGAAIQRSVYHMQQFVEDEWENL